MFKDQNVFSPFELESKCGKCSHPASSSDSLHCHPNHCLFSSAAPRPERSVRNSGTSRQKLGSVCALTGMHVLEVSALQERGKVGPAKAFSTSAEKGKQKFAKRGKKILSYSFYFDRVSVGPRISTESPSQPR